MFDMDGHDSEVTNIKCLAERQIVITSSWDGLTRIFMVRENKEPINIATVSHELAYRKVSERNTASKP